MDMEKDLVHDSRGCGCGQANAGMDKRICEVGSVGAFCTTDLYWIALCPRRDSEGANHKRKPKLKGLLPRNPGLAYA
eukprot:2408166-Rhodomonas_salina.2